MSQFKALCFTDRKLVFKFLAFFILSVFSYSSFADASTLTRPTHEGLVIGFENENKTISWQGIPYAQPPVKNLRWKAPLPPGQRTSPFIANDNSSLCPQLAGILTTLNIFKWNSVIGNEDCLHLNITAPQHSKANDKLPVMVWIHGGGNSIGYKGNTAYTGEQLAQKGQVIVVSINYRLGPLGWFYHPALNETYENPADRSGNFGTLDIIQALIWVNNNIENFGGDPNNVTIFGESAGGFNVYSLLISPLAKGLFHRAIVQSGGLRTISHEFASGLPTSSVSASAIAEDTLTASDKKFISHPLSSATILGQLLLEQKYAKDKDESLQLQKTMEPDSLAKILYQTTPENLLLRYPTRAAGMINFPGVFKDGHVLPHEEPEQLFRNADKFNSVPVMLGTNRDENKVFMALDPGFVNWRMQPKDSQTYNRTAKYLADAWKAKGVDEFATLLADSQEHVYAYRFDWDELPKILDLDLSELIGAGHGLEIPFVFGSLLSDFNIHLLFGLSGTESREALSDAIVSYWTEFAHTGNPATGRNNNLPQWSSWNNNDAHNKFIILDAGDEGIKMNGEILNQKILKERLASDATFTSNEERCLLYQTLFIRDDYLGFDEQEYNQFGPQGCKDVGINIHRL